MTKFKKSTFTIRGHKGDSTVSGITTSHFGIDKRGGEYIITHLPSGWSISRDDQLKRAREITSDLEGLGINWADITVQNLPHHPRIKEITTIARGF